MRPILATSFTLLLGLSACDTAPDDSTEIPVWAVSGEPLLSIGQIDGDPEYLFSGVAAVDLLPAGRVVVADRSSGTLRIYRSDGRLEQQMGGLGQGPGEFEYLTTVFAIPPDTIAAFDAGANRLTKFLENGELASTLNLRADEGYPEVFLGTASDGSHVVAWIRAEARRDLSSLTADIMRLGRFAPDGNPVATLTTDVGMRRVGSPVPLSAHFLGSLIGDTAFHTDGLFGEVRATQLTGAPVRSFRIPGESADPQSALERLRPMLDSVELVRLARLEGSPGLDTIPMISELLASDDGLLWLKRYDPMTDSHWIGRRRTGGEWLAVATGGSVVGRVEMPAAFRPMDFAVDRVAGVAYDELGIERVCDRLRTTATACKLTSVRFDRVAQRRYVSTRNEQGRQRSTGLASVRVGRFGGAGRGWPAVRGAYCQR